MDYYNNYPIIKGVPLTPSRYSQCYYRKIVHVPHTPCTWGKWNTFKIWQFLINFDTFFR